MLIPPPLALEVQDPYSLFVEPNADQLSSFTEELSPSQHPQSQVFGAHAGLVRVGVNPQSTLAVISPRHCGSDFGVFRTPHLDEVRNRAFAKLDDSLSLWTLSSAHHERSRIAFVPPETGRALLLPPSSHPIYRDVLVKGTGLVERYTRQNKLRYASRGFDGWLEMSEAERDMVHTEILQQAGVRVTAGVAVTNQHHLQDYSDFTAWTGNYVRAFRVQTRISNLFELDIPTRRAALKDGMAQLAKIENRPELTDYVEYFRYMIEQCARTVAIMQAIGFTQDSFHYGQITLAGEVTDLGIGSFRRVTEPGVVNTLHAWFRFERQPILMANILYKTHAVKAEPVPARLDKNSRSVQEQTTLFGAITSVEPSVAQAIEAIEPEKLFWQIYEDTYRRFDAKRFERDVLSRLEASFVWEPKAVLNQIPEALRGAVMSRYTESLKKLEEHFELQVATWDRRGPTAIHRQILFGAATRAHLPMLTLDFSEESIGVWAEAGNEVSYLSKNGETWNTIGDLSWKPDGMNC